MQRDPWAAWNYFSQAESGGENRLYPRMSREELADLRDRANKAIVQRRREVSDGVDQQVFSGQLRDEPEGIHLRISRRNF